MKYTKKDISEIIDSNGNLIGADDIPKNGSDFESQANNTSDYNAKIGTQPFRYDMLGRFGFSLMPFMEGDEKNDGQVKLKNELIDLMHTRFLDILKYYKSNPKRILSDYRKHITDGEVSEITKKHNVEWAGKILKIIEKHFSSALNQIDNIDESIVVEDIMVNKKEDEMSTKTDGGDIKEKKIKKIAGLINKLEKKDIDTLINLLEIKKNG